MPIDSRTYHDPNKLGSPAEEGRFVHNDYTRAKDQVVDRMRDKWWELYQAYRGVLDLRGDSLTSQIVHPLIWTNVEDALPRLTANLPQIDVGPRSPDDETRAAKHRNLAFYDWDILSMAIKLIHIAKSAEVFGTCFTKSYWRKKVETRASRRVVPTFTGGLGVADFFGRPATKIEHVVEQHTVYDDPDLAVLWPDELFFEPHARSLESSPWAIHRIRTSLHEIESAKGDKGPLYRPGVVSQLKERMQHGNPVHNPYRTLSEYHREEFQQQGSRSGQTSNPNNREVHLLEWWSDTKVVVVVEEFPDLPPLRSEYNLLGRKPFSVFTPMMDLGGVYGISLAEILLSFQVELSTLHSANLDNVLYSVHQMWTVLHTSGISPHQLRFRPGGMVPVKQHSDIAPLPRNFDNFSFPRTIDSVRQMAQEAGLTSTFGGRGDNLSGGTATEASILFEASQSRVSLMFQILGLQYLTDYGKMNLRLNELFMDTDHMVRVLGDNFRPVVTDVVRPEDLLSNTGLDLDFKIDIAQTEPSNRQFRLARAKDMLATIGQAGLPPNHPLMRKMFVELAIGYGIDNPESLVGPGNEQAATIEELVGRAGLEGGQGEGPAIPEGLGAALATQAEAAAPEISDVGLEASGAFAN